jgi:hypothetical protein
METRVFLKQYSLRLTSLTPLARLPGSHSRMASTRRKRMAVMLFSWSVSSMGDSLPDGVDISVLYSAVGSPDDISIDEAAADEIVKEPWPVWNNGTPATMA